MQRESSAGWQGLRGGLQHACATQLLTFRLTAPRLSVSKQLSALTSCFTRLISFRCYFIPWLNTTRAGWSISTLTINDNGTRCRGRRWFGCLFCLLQWYSLPVSKSAISDLARRTVALQTWCRAMVPGHLRVVCLAIPACQETPATTMLPATCTSMDVLI